MIWKATFAGETFIPKRRWAELTPLTKDSKNGIALLRTCRQLYLETSLHPMIHGTLDYDGRLCYPFFLKALKVYQRERVNRIRISLPYMAAACKWRIIDGIFRAFDMLPALDEAEILIHKVADPNGDRFLNKRNQIIKFLETGMDEVADNVVKVKVKVEGTNEKMDLSKFGTQSYHR